MTSKTDPVLTELYAKICAEPHSDAHRLDYCIALAEDDPRRRFIQLQLATAERRRQQRSCVSAPELEEIRLLRRYRDVWNEGLVAHLATSHESSYEYDRGFISMIECRARHFVEAGEKILGIAPIRHVRFHSERDIDFPELLRCPQLRYLESIGFRGWRLTPSEIQALALCQNLQNCVELDLAGNTICLNGYIALAESPITRAICHINFSPLGGNIDFPGRTHIPDLDDIHPITELPRLKYRPMPPQGRLFEKRFGYIHWLHPSTNISAQFDLWHHVKNGIFPERQPGSPVDYDHDPYDGKPADSGR